MSDFQNLNPPPGFVAGCLPRYYKAGSMAPLFEEHIQVIPPNEWDGILNERELRGASLLGRDDVQSIKDQDGVGSCATESTSQSVELVAQRSGYLFEELNPWSIYRVTSGGRDQGSAIDEDLVFARDVGVLPISYFPRYNVHDDSQSGIVNRWNAIPPDGWKEVAAKYRVSEWYDITTIDEIGTALLLGYPVVIGWNSHSEVLVDLLPGAQAVVANSWRKDWGDHGFHVEPLSKVDFRYGAFAVRTVVDRGV